jgi:predicted ArsR family transcriptional regulator
VTQPFFRTAVELTTRAVAVPRAPPAAEGIAEVSRRLALGAVRERFLQYIADHPGATIQAAATAMGSSHSTATFYLNSLVRMQLVMRQRDGRTIQHFYGSRQTTVSLLQPFLRDARSERICQELARPRPAAVSVNQFAKQLQLNYGFVLRTLRRLATAGFVQLSRPRARYMFNATESMARAAEEMGWPREPPPKDDLGPIDAPDADGFP